MAQSFELSKNMSVLTKPPSSRHAAAQTTSRANGRTNAEDRGIQMARGQKAAQGAEGSTQ